MKELFKALAGLQNDMPIIEKDKAGHNYSYTPLPTIVEQIKPLLKKHGLGFYQAINGSSIKTVVFHCLSGEMIESITDMPVESLVYVDVEKKDRQGNPYTKSVLQGFDAMNTAQAYGSLITYFRRYSLSALLGLVTEKDADARNDRMEDAKPLPELLPTSENWAGAVEGIVNGFTVIQIRKKYSLSDENAELLENEAATSGQTKKTKKDEKA